MGNYPIVLRNCLFVLGIFAAVPTASEAFSQGSFGGLDYVNFMMDEFSLLNITSLGRNLLEDQNECGFACLEIPSCISYNVAAFPDINGKLLCELLPSDKYNNSDKFIPSQYFHHFSIPSPCSSWPCKNSGKCVSLYKENSYKCVCKEGFMGQNCEIDINECESSPCLNNGTCTDQVNGFNCTCPPGFAGNRCNETAVSFNSTLAQFLAPVVGNNAKWVLCYRATIHGWAGSTFHSRCDGKKHTVTIITNGPYVFGGYTDVACESSGGYKRTSNSFIFSLRNNERLPPFKSTVTKPKFAIYCHPSYGPTFGGGGGGSDLRIADHANSNSYSYTDFGHSYSLPSGVSNRLTILAGTHYFSPDEVEVYYLG